MKNRLLLIWLLMIANGGKFWRKVVDEIVDKIR